MVRQRWAVALVAPRMLVMARVVVVVLMPWGVRRR